MKLAYINVKNFRGIQSFSFQFPISQNIFCIIGSGDSCKSTLLNAIEWCLCPSRYLLASDLDFYNCDTSNPIIIECSLRDIPDTLLTEDKYGLYLRDLEAVVNGINNDEPVDGKESVLTIRLTIDESLETEWTVVNNRCEPKRMSYSDRKKISVGVVGSNYDKDFLWGRTSVLQQYTESSKEVLHNAYTKAMREAVDKTELKDLDSITDKIDIIGKEYGVSFNGEIHNKLLMQNSSYTTSVGLFDDKVPFSQRGSGSKRLLSIGLNLQLLSSDRVALIDEIESGLEPYRICSLINRIRSIEEGQIIFTTHSRSVICECKVDELFVLNNQNGMVKCYALAEQNTRDTVQSIMRSEPDAFLCKRIIVCEGKTEQGLLRALDNIIFKEIHTRFAFYGVGVAVGGGSNLFKLAKLLKQCGYDVCVLMDSDVNVEEKRKKECEDLGIKVFSWTKDYSIEEQLFRDASKECVNEMIDLAVNNKSFESIKNRLIDNINHATDIFDFSGEKITLVKEVDEEKLKQIGTLAKGKRNPGNDCLEGGWYKRIDFGEELGYLVLKKGYMKEDSTFMTVMSYIREWVCKDEL